MVIAPKVMFITVGHPVDTEDRKVWLTGGPIDVAENVWIGAGSTILPGVSIGHDAVIAVGSTTRTGSIRGSDMAGSPHLVA